MQRHELFKALAYARGLVDGSPCCGVAAALVLTLLAIPAALQAQLRVDVFHASARSTSPLLHAIREAATAARARERQAAGYSNPVFSFGREQTSHGDEQNAQNIFELSQGLDVSGQRDARISAARLRSEQSLRSVAAAEQQLDYEVSVAFANAWASEHRVAIAAEGTVAFQEATRVATARLEAGDVSGYEVRRLGLEAARFAAVSATLSLELLETRRLLSTLTTTRWRVGDTLVLEAVDVGGQAARTELLIDSLVSSALRDRPDLQALELEIAIRRAEARLTSRERIPTPTLSLGYKSERVGDFDVGSRSGFTGYVVGISVPLPVFDRSDGAMAATQADARVAEARITNARVLVAREVADAADALQTVERQLVALAAHLGAEAEAALVAVHLSYAEGEITLVEWLDAMRAYQEAQLAFITLQAAHASSQAALNRAVGVSSGIPIAKER